MTDDIFRVTIVHRVDPDTQDEHLESVWVSRQDAIARSEEIAEEGFDSTYQSIAVYTNRDLLFRNDIVVGGDWWESDERRVAMGAP